MQLTRITFPEICLPTREAHKLRGYFGRLFQEHSPLLHNHLEQGGLRYGYPLVQYKVIDHIPTLVGIEEGSRLLTKLFLSIKQLELNGKTYPVHHKHITNWQISPQVNGSLYRYEFATRWMALNQKNYRIYQNCQEEEERQNLLARILRGNLLIFLREVGIELSPEEHILVRPDVTACMTRFKNQPMLAFGGHFVCNVELPEYIGLGKAVSRGFGTIVQSNKSE